MDHKLLFSFSFIQQQNNIHVTSQEDIVLAISIQNKHAAKVNFS